MKTVIHYGLSLEIVHQISFETKLILHFCTLFYIRLDLRKRKINQKDNFQVYTILII